MRAPRVLLALLVGCAALLGPLAATPAHAATSSAENSSPSLAASASGTPNSPYLATRNSLPATGSIRSNPRPTTNPARSGSAPCGVQTIDGASGTQYSGVMSVPVSRQT